MIMRRSSIKQPTMCREPCEHNIMLMSIMIEFECAGSIHA
jgi:hypothetical protein